MHLLEGFYMIPFYLLYSELYGNINEKTLDKPKQFSSFAKCTTIEEKLLALKPKNLDFVQAVGLPLTIERAYDGLEGLDFLLTSVWYLNSRAATSSTGKLELMKSLGADLAEKFDVVYDAVRKKPNNDHEHGDAYQAAKVEFFRVFSLVISRGSVVKNSLVG
ncbi:2-methylene-furan-3-one reductase-like [Vitis vinifera]|uniref:2-methylene-furan-3-one reductase-like n=1 Tax=Vitis vinifera TaxID=29760 RepID=UPI0028831629|nr:2-methylene-furan-3-one reductase-like [Vitis vinifera]